jgi:AraC-like DNA-binding protein
MFSETNRIDLEISAIYYRSMTIASTYVQKSRPSSSLIIYVKGGHRFDFGNVKFEAREGEMVYLPVGSSYINTLLSPDTEYYQINFNFFKNNKPYPLWNCWQSFSADFSLKYLLIFKEIYEFYAIHDNAYHLFCSAWLLKIIGTICKDLEYAKKNSCGVKRIEKTVNHLNEFYYLNTSVEELARMSSTSVSNLEKTFKNACNSTPIAYRNKIRIEHAKQLLDGGYSVAEVANKVGFSDVYYFSKIFKKICGTPPGRYSKDNRTI